MSNTECFQGRWRLSRCFGTSGDEVIFPLGESPFGSIVYTENYVMVLIAKSNRQKFSTEDFRDVPRAEVLADFPNYEAYCGTYDINAESNMIVHHLECSKVPNHISTDFRRHYSFRDNKLVLSTVDPVPLNGRDWAVELEWLREE